MLVLDDCNAVSRAGNLTPKAWTDREGIARPALDLVASQVLTAYHVNRKRKALERKPPDPSEPQPASRLDELDDGAPLDFCAAQGLSERVISVAGPACRLDSHG